MSATFRDETWNPGLHHRVEPASDLNPVDLVNGSFWNLRDVVVLASSIQGFRGGKDGCSTLESPRPAGPGPASERFAGRWLELSDLPVGRAASHDPTAQMPIKTMPFCLQNSNSSVCGRYGCDSTWTTAGLILAASQRGTRFSRVTSDNPIALHLPPSTRLSIALHVSSRVTPRS